MGRDQQGGSIARIALMMKLAILKSARKWRRRDLIMLFERLGMYISAGLAPTDALSAACGGASRESRKRHWRRLKNRLSKAVYYPKACASR